MFVSIQIYRTVLLRKHARAINMEKLTNSKKEKKRKKKKLFRHHLTVYLCCLRRGFSRIHARKKDDGVSKERDTEGRPYRTLKILFFFILLTFRLNLTIDTHLFPHLSLSFFLIEHSYPSFTYISRCLYSIIH